MRIFDAHIRSETRSDDDLKNLAYFGTEQVVTTAHARREFERAEDLLAYFEQLRTDESARIKTCGVTPHVALGVLPDARPRRSHPEVWTELPELLRRDRVSAVGEIGAWRDTEDHWELFERQVRMAKEAELPIVATPPRELKVNMTYKMMLRIEEAGFPPERAVMNYLDERLVETVVRDGFVAGVALGVRDLDPRRAAEVVDDTVRAVGHADRIVLNSALRAGASDVLGVPKTATELDERGAGAEVIDQLTYRNAEEVFESGARQR